MATSVRVELGPPTRETSKAWIWNISDDFAVMVEKGPQRFANVWLPRNSAETYPPYAELYPGSRGRHSHTYTCAAMRKGLPVVCFKPALDRQVSETMEYVLRAYKSHLAR